MRSRFGSLAAMTVLFGFSGCGPGNGGKDGGADRGPEAPQFDLAFDIGGDVPGQGCFPPCLQAMFASCPYPAGSCVQMVDTINGIRNSCFENGVRIRELTYGRDRGSVFLPSSNTYCYLFTTGPDTFGRYETRTMVVAEVTFDSDTSNQGTITCLGTGQTYPIDLDSPACADSRTGIAGATQTTCTTGTCDIPPPI